MSRIALTAPPACSSCGGQYIERRHVDFEAAFDGPVLNQLEVVVEGHTPVQIDDLVVCEECLREAFRLLEWDGLSDKERYGLAQRNSELEAMNRGQARYIEQLERALSARAVVKPPVKTRGRKAAA